MEITYASPSSNNLAGVAAAASSSSSSMSSSSLTRPIKIIPLQHPSTAPVSSFPSSTSSSPFHSVFSRWKTKVKRMTLLEWIEMFLPCFRWIRTYKWREYLQVDLMAGLTVGIMLVPQVIHFSFSEYLIEVLFRLLN